MGLSNIEDEKVVSAAFMGVSFIRKSCFACSIKPWLPFPRCITWTEKEFVPETSQE
jgi:hypothetical protein